MPYVNDSLPCTGEITMKMVWDYLYRNEAVMPAFPANLPLEHLFHRAYKFKDNTAPYNLKDFLCYNDALDGLTKPGLSVHFEAPSATSDLFILTLPSPLTGADIHTAYIEVEVPGGWENKYLVVIPIGSTAGSVEIEHPCEDADIRARYSKEESVDSDTVFYTSLPSNPIALTVQSCTPVTPTADFTYVLTYDEGPGGVLKYSGNTTVNSNGWTVVTTIGGTPYNSYPFDFTLARIDPCRSVNVSLALYYQGSYKATQNASITTAGPCGNITATPGTIMKVVDSATREAYITESPTDTWMWPQVAYVEEITFEIENKDTGHKSYASFPYSNGGKYYLTHPSGNCVDFTVMAKYKSSWSPDGDWGPEYPYHYYGICEAPDAGGLTVSQDLSDPTGRTIHVIANLNNYATIAVVEAKRTGSSDDKASIEIPLYPGPLHNHGVGYLKVPYSCDRYKFYLWGYNIAFEGSDIFTDINRPAFTLEPGCCGEMGSLFCAFAFEASTKQLHYIITTSDGFEACASDDNFKIRIRSSYVLAPQAGYTGPGDGTERIEIEQIRITKNKVGYIIIQDDIMCMGDYFWDTDVIDDINRVIRFNVDISSLRNDYTFDGAKRKRVAGTVDHGYFETPAQCANIIDPPPEIPASMTGIMYEITGLQEITVTAHVLNNPTYAITKYVHRLGVGGTIIESANAGYKISLPSTDTIYDYYFTSYIPMIGILNWIKQPLIIYSGRAFNTPTLTSAPFSGDIKYTATVNAADVEHMGTYIFTVTNEEGYTEVFKQDTNTLTIPFIGLCNKYSCTLILRDPNEKFLDSTPVTVEDTTPGSCTIPPAPVLSGAFAPKADDESKIMATLTVGTIPSDVTNVTIYEGGLGYNYLPGVSMVLEIPRCTETTFTADFRNPKGTGPLSNAVVNSADTVWCTIPTPDIIYSKSVYSFVIYEVRVFVEKYIITSSTELEIEVTKPDGSIIKFTGVGGIKSVTLPNRNTLYHIKARIKDTGTNWSAWSIDYTLKTL